MSQNQIIISRVKIGKLLKNKRLSLKITKSKLSEITTLSRPTIDAIENATKSYNIDSYILYLEGINETISL